MDGLIDKILAKIGENMSKGVLSNRVDISTAYGQYYNGATVTLEPGTKYLVLANTKTSIGSTFTTLVNVSFSGTLIDSIGSESRTNVGSGAGVCCWYYVETGDSSVTATAVLYGYYSETHTETSRIVAIPLPLITRSVSDSVIDDTSSYISENTYRPPIAYLTANCPNLIASDTNRTWRLINTFSNYSTTQFTTNEDYFANDTNGFLIKKPGIYKFTVNVHFNAAASGNDYAVDIYNYTTGNEIVISRYLSDYSKSWVSGMTFGVSSVGADQIVIPRFQRYNGSQLWKPSSVLYSVEYLSDSWQV